MSKSNPQLARTSRITDQPAATHPIKPSIVRIVGTGEGIVMRIGDRGGRWSDIVHILADHLAKAEGFFQGERIAIEIGARLLRADDLQQIADVLASYNITIWTVRTSNPETQRMVQEIGLAAEERHEANGDHLQPMIQDEHARWEVHLGRTGQQAPSARPVEGFQPPQAIADSIAEKAIDPDIADEETDDLPMLQADQGTEASTSESEENEDNLNDQEMIFAPPYIFHGTLRSGQVFRHAGTVMVVGDVNPGAELISGGDIFIWGKLRGIVHAGAMGNERSVVCAIDFEPIQLRIAGHIAMSPKAASNEPGRWFWRRSAVEKPEVARVIGKQIVVDVWDSQ